MSFRKTLIMCAALLVTPSVAMADAPGEPEITTVRMASVVPSGTPWSAMLSRAKQRIQSAGTLGEDAGANAGKKTIKVKLYLGGKLGSENGLVRRCQSGKISGIAVSNGALGSAVPELFATELPFMFENYEQADNAIDAAMPLIRKLLEEKGFVLYMPGENGFRHFASKKKFFTSPEQLAGEKMRAQPAMPHTEMYAVLGASASTISVGEVAGALGNGVVDGYDNTLLYAFATQWHTNVKYVTLSAHIYQAALVVWCKGWFDKQSPAVQKILLDAPPAEVNQGRAAVRAMNKLLESKYEKAGLELKSLTPSQRAAFKAKTDVVIRKFEKQTSPRGRELLSILQKHAK